MPRPWLTRRGEDVADDLEAARAALEAGNLEDARKLAENAFKHHPENDGALRLLLRIAMRAGDHERLIPLFEIAVARWPEDAELHYNFGVALTEKRQFEKALAQYAQAIARKPSDIAYNNRGVLLSKLGRHEEALASYTQAIALSPHYAEAYNNRGNSLNELKKFEDSLPNFLQAIALKPDYPQAHYNAGVALIGLERYAQALQSLARAMELKPDYVEAYNNYGIVLGHLNRQEEALTYFDKALQCEPNFVEAYNNRGNALEDLQRHEEALQSYDRALEIFPTYAGAHRNKGIFYLNLLQLEEAEKHYEAAIAADPTYPDTYWDRALLSLLKGDFEKGWKLYEERRRAGILREFAEPLWLGKESLEGKTILLHGEQGIGDTIQFCRYIPLVAERGARIILDIQKPLLRLLRQFDEVAHVIPPGKILPKFDYQCPLLSLPLAFGTTLETIPFAQGYLKEKSYQREMWRARLGNPQGPLVGLVWRGNPEHKRDRERSIPLAEMLRALPVHLRYISLQRDLVETDQEAFAHAPQLTHFGEALVDFTDTAALISLMDMVITVDTSVAHLAGAMGKEVWILLPYRPDFRWMLHRADSPWYASATLYRQSKRGVWHHTLEQVKEDLLQRFPVHH